ncbi:MAG: hypothetical protein SOT07_08955 [Paludibacteraceae bacterium]|nr:hypothetical protein [Paludibacteraceae bacterium]
MRAQAPRTIRLIGSGKVQALRVNAMQIQPVRSELPAGETPASPVS